MSALSAIKIWPPPVASMTKGRKGFRSISDLISSIFTTATYGIKMPAQEGDGLSGTGGTRPQWPPTILLTGQDSPGFSGWRMIRIVRAEMIRTCSVRRIYKNIRHRIAPDAI
jgi:hypothetical protein